MNLPGNQITLDCPDKTEFGPVSLVIIQPTSFCNINCDYCYLPERSSRRILNLDLLEPIFTRLLTSSFVRKDFTVVWHAGEPLSVPISFYETAICKINELDSKFNLNKYAISHNFQTNGTLLNQAWCDLIKTHNISIGVSLDGPAFIHDAHRKTRTGLGTHTSTMRGISLLQRNNIDFHVIAVLTEESLDFPDEIFNFFSENGIRQIGFNIEEIEGMNRSSSLQSKKHEEKYRIFMKRFYELTKNADGFLKVREFEDITNTICSQGMVAKGLFTPFTMLNIDCNGNFTTFSPELLGMKSAVYGDFILGNLWRHTLDSVCITNKFITLNKDIQAGFELCRKTCDYFAVCGGGTPSNKYFENGTFRSSETMNCRYTTKILTDMILSDIERALGL